MVAQAGLSRALPAPEGGAGQLYLTCTLAGAHYLVRATAVREVEEITAITPIPATPAWLRGVMNLRGTIVGVVDLAQFLGLSAARDASPGLGNEALICAPLIDGQASGDEVLIALAVDAVRNIRTLTAADLLPLPEQPQSGAMATYLIGLYRPSSGAGQGGDLLGVLDLDALLRALVTEHLVAPDPRS